MPTDYTQQQSQEDEQHAQELSLKRTRPPAEVAGYETQRFLGSGAYGEVWVAVDQNTGRRVAIKFYTHRGGIDWSLLSREVEKLAVLSADRYVVQLLDVGWDADPPYYVMDYIENGSLEDLLKQDGPRPLEESIELFHEVAVGLMHLHGKGVLHCDLKPANVLLDEDNKPRLADFGQSRLSHEQSPALGTLFYMAPEQADLESVPDAKWDVYALGALLYCMLTGEPPHRSDESIEEIESSSDLADRLARYRSAITNGPKLVVNRKIPGIDRALADIIERCLAVNPKERFANVQGVLDALQAREEARARRPLLILGFVGPTLLLLVMALFGWGVYGEAVGETDQSLTRKAQESNSWAAQNVAGNAARQINRYYEAVEKVAREKSYADFRQLIDVVLQDTELRELREALSNPNDNSPVGEEEKKRINELRNRFINHADRMALQLAIEGVMREANLPNDASWFVCDAQGTQLAAQFKQASFAPTVGKNYSYRTYFHGGPEDLTRAASEDGVKGPLYDRPPPDQHIRRSHLSSPFVSTATGTWKVAISTPLFKSEEFVGIVAVTVEMGEFVDFENRDVQYAVLVDGRQGRYKGAILEHPLFPQYREKGEKLPEQFREYRFPLDQITTENPIVRDPLGQHPDGKQAYSQQWIAGRATVMRPIFSQESRSTTGKSPNAVGSVPKEDTGLIVLALEDRNSVVAPAYSLGNRLLRLGFWALIVMITVSLALWYLVVRTFRETQRRVARAAQSFSTSASLHSMKTLTAPNTRTSS